MAVKMRLRRMGSRNAPFYRVVVQDARRAPTGRFIETIGWYDPKQENKNFSIDLERVEYWVSNGAQSSETVASLIKKAQTLPIDKSVSGNITEEEVPTEVVETETIEDKQVEDISVEEEVSAEESEIESEKSDT